MTVTEAPIAAGEQLFYPEHILPNPWQTRLDEDAEHIAGIAASIADVGLLQTPIGRLHPDMPGTVQLAFGHSRLSAWKQAKPNEPFPVVLRQLSDRKMSDLAAEENSRRKDLSAIETARAIAKRMADFKLTQVEAGKPFGYTSQGSVANVLRLLKLPEAIQAHVAAGTLPERLAREIIPLSKILPNDAAAIAGKVAKAESGHRADVLASEFQVLLHKRAKWFHDVPWKLDWPAEPIKVDGHKSIALIPACTGCEYFVKRDFGSDACLRTECFDLKHKYAVAAEVEKACKRLKIGVSAGEHTEMVYDGDMRQEVLATNALATDRTLLRLAPHEASDYHGYDRKRVLGSEYVDLRTIDLVALKKAIANLPKEKKTTATGFNNPHQADFNRQRQESNKRRAEIVRLYRAAAVHLAPAFALPEPVVAALIPTMALSHWSESSRQVKERAEKADAAAKARIVAELVINQHVSGGALMYSSVKPDDARAQIENLAEALKVKLPAGWHELPAPKLEVKPTPKPTTNKRAAAAAAARAQVLASAKRGAGHVRGHTRPAPKPGKKGKGK